MPVFFVHDVNHGIVTPLDRKFRIREINPTPEVNPGKAIHDKKDSNPDDFKYPPQPPEHQKQREQSPGQQRKAINAYKDHNQASPISLGKVKDIMSRPVIHGFQDQSLETAWKLMLQHEIRHLVVLNDQFQYCGLLSDKVITPFLMNLITQADLTQHPGEILLTQFCAGNLLSTHPETEISDLGSAMLEYGLDAIAVSENGRIIGIVTKSDIFKVILKHQTLEVTA